MRALLLACVVCLTAPAVHAADPAAPASTGTPASTPATASAITPSGTPARRAVLVTGASGGIGRRIVDRLAAAGFHVYAGARKAPDLEALSAIPNVTGVRLDVNDPADIAAAVEKVRASGDALYGLVNNAGVVIVDPVLATKDEDFDFQMQANVYGVFRVTKAFAPLVIEARGRILNISSISAFLSLPGNAAYTMSKAGIEGFTNVLASELAPLNVAVIGIEPGAYNTDIMKRALERSTTKGFNADRSAMKPPDEVATAVLQALTDERPKRRYMVAPTQTAAERAIRGALEMVAQLNEGQPYAYDRATLVKMLDEALANARP
jgi:NAD(P)-dependent dehydrogenase (short-subunit alcohol dehydrogenase family)